MKTKYRFLFVLTLMFTLVTSAWAQQTWESGNTKVTLSDNGVFTVTAVDGTDGKMADYESRDDVPWISYEFRNQIKSVVISNGVTSIGKYAFSQFYNVQDISIGNDVKSIGSYAFSEWWNSVSSLTLPASLEFIADKAISQTNINKLYVKATTPPVLETNDAIMWAKIYVPEGCVNAYQSAEYWQNRNIAMDFSDYYVPFTFDESGMTTMTGTAWKGIKQTLNVTLNDGNSIASRSNLAEDNSFTPAKDAKDYSFGFTIAFPDAANLSFEQSEVSSNLFFVGQMDKVNINLGTPDDKGKIADVKAGTEVKMTVPKGYKIGKMTVRPASTSIVYSNGTVAFDDLKQGDIIADDVTLTNDNNKTIHFIANRWGNQYDGISSWGSVTSSDIFTTNEEALIFNWYIPYNNVGVKGNAWVVEKIVTDDPEEWNNGIYLAGITLDAEVTFNENRTEAVFNMPVDETTVRFEVLRDMTVDVDINLLMDDKPVTRVRIAKNRYGNYEIVGNLEVAAIDKMDGNKKLTYDEFYFNFMKKVDDEYIYYNFSPGIWRIEAVANKGGGYTGTTYSEDIEFYEGYEVTVGAGEYATFYKDEAVRLDEADKENFKLYTVSSVSGDKATLSNAFDAAPSNTPFLVYNNTNESKTVLLIPCNEPDLALTVADQFLGTMEEKTFTDADMAAADYYVCNGKQFVKVRGAGTLGANKAYLKFVTDQQLSAPQYISISGDLGEGTTGLDASLVNSEEVNSVWYDLNGRKLNGKPAQKGIYIKNGKKIVVK